MKNSRHLCDSRSGGMEKMTVTQKDILLSFMEDHLDFARGRLQNIEGRVICKSLWSVLAQQLNSSGTQKTIQQWQRTWTDVKIKVKRKLSAMKVIRKKKGGGRMLPIRINDFDNRVIQIMSEETLFGIPGPEINKKASEQPLTLEEAGSSDLQENNSPASSSDLSRLQTTEYIKSEMLLLNSDETSLTVTSELKRKPDKNQQPQTPPKTRQQITEEVKLLREIRDMKHEISYINEKLGKIINQNDRQYEERKTTNILLDRIATALERQHTDRK